jgi:hypothetical protein
MTKKKSNNNPNKSATGTTSVPTFDNTSSATTSTSKVDKKTLDEDFMRALDDPNYVTTITDINRASALNDRITELINSSFVNPPSSEEHPHTCVSIHNLRDRYISNVKMTSLVGYMYCALDQYRDMFDMTPQELKRPEVEEQMQAEMSVIKKFMDYLFEFSPDRHIRPHAHYDEDSNDRSKIKITRLIDELEAELAANQAVPRDSPTYNALRVEELTELIDNVKAHKDVNMRMQRRYYRYNKLRVGETEVPVQSFEVFNNWRIYEEHNYDNIRALVDAIYCEKADLEYLINVHDTFPSAAAARKYIETQSNMAKSTVYAIENKQWTFIGAFKENRERLEFYNANNQILKAIQTRVEEESTIGKELIKQRIKKGQNTSLAKGGPIDLKGLDAYKESNTDLEEIENNTITQADRDQQKLANDLVREGKLKQEDLLSGIDADGTPINAVTVDIHKFGGKFPKRTRIYTKSTNEPIPDPDQ